MALIPNDQSLFIVDLRYIASRENIEPALNPHVAFLEANYAAGVFLASGPKVPRTGGLIIATAPAHAALDAILETDPFKEQGLAEYTVTEFRATMRAAPLLS